MKKLIIMKLEPKQIFIYIILIQPQDLEQSNIKLLYYGINCLPLPKTWNLYQTLKKKKSTCSQRNNSGILNVLLLSCTFLLCIQLFFESLVTIECLFVYCHWTLIFSISDCFYCISHLYVFLFLCFIVFIKTILHYIIS